MYIILILHNAYYIIFLRRMLVIANVVPSSPILVTLMMERVRSSETSVLTAFLTFFPVTAIKVSHVTEELQQIFFWFHWQS
jgi:hypothetical protein